jgi:hypothetical protein
LRLKNAIGINRWKLGQNRRSGSQLEFKLRDVKHWVDSSLKGQIQLISNGTHLADDGKRPIKFG